MTKFHQRYLELPRVFYTQAQPQRVTNPKLVLYNNTLAQTINWDSKDKLSILSGNQALLDSKPLALAYGGHQYGRYTMLGDGRAHLLATLSGKHTVDIQLKGSGPTVYSRGGDGLAALQPMLREYIISEAMHALGVATTRSLAVVKTDTPIQRDTDDHAAVLTRLATSHIRFGTFEYASRLEDTAHLAQLLNYVIKHHYPELTTKANKAQALLECISDKLVDLIVAWMRIGFIHGVMNTDNMSIVGETIDYGPCAFMDNYHPATVYSYIDKYGRYAFANQPAIAQWNITCLANALTSLLDKDEQKAQRAVKTISERFKTKFITKYQCMVCNKLGFDTYTEENGQYVKTLLSWMQNNKADYTNTFKILSYAEDIKQHPQYDKALAKWYDSWQQAIDKQSSYPLMQQTNPVVIPRNHHVQQALQASTTGNYTATNNLLKAICKPYTDTYSDYQEPPAEHEKVHFTYCGT